MKPRRRRDPPHLTEEAVAPPDGAGDPCYAMLLQWLADDADQGDETGFEPEQALRDRGREGGWA